MGWWARGTGRPRGIARPLLTREVLMMHGFTRAPALEEEDHRVEVPHSAACGMVLSSIVLSFLLTAPWKSDQERVYEVVRGMLR